MGKTRILKLEPTERDEAKELEFELDFLGSLSVQERFDMLFETSRLLKEMLYRYGRRKPFEIVKVKPRRR